MPIQVGYCNGSNYLLNAVEYHRDSEVNVALTDLILILGKEQDIEADGTYQTEKMEAFLVPAGTVVEVYATTLHYAPCNVNENKSVQQSFFRKEQTKMHRHHRTIQQKTNCFLQKINGSSHIKMQKFRALLKD